MIEIVLKQKGNRISGFSVKGHSNLDKKGKDIVCAAVSSLTETAILGLGNHLKRDVEYKVDSGDLFVNLLDEPDELTDAVLQTMLLGLREIERLYPKIVEIKAR